MNDVNNDDDELTREASLAKIKAEANLAAGYDVAAIVASAPPPPAKKFKSAHEEEAKRKARLESNRKAARESRRRKKVLVEELQRSVIFFTRANAQLRQKNDSLSNMLMAARSQIVQNNNDNNNHHHNETSRTRSSAGGSSLTPGEEQHPATASATSVDEAGVPGKCKGKTTPPSPSSSGEGGIKKDEKQTTMAAEYRVPTNSAVPSTSMAATIASATSQDLSPQVSSSSKPNSSNNSSNINAQMMANWLALAQVQAQQAAAAGSNNSCLAGMVPNPMLSSTTTFPLMFSHDHTTTTALGMHHPNYSNVQQLQHSQFVPSLPPPLSASTEASSATASATLV